MTKDELLRIILDFGLYYADKSLRNVIQVFKDADKTVRLVSVCKDEMYNFSTEQWYSPADQPIGVSEPVMHAIVDYAYTPVNDRQNNEPLTSAQARYEEACKRWDKSMDECLKASKELLDEMGR